MTSNILAVFKYKSEVYLRPFANFDSFASIDKFVAEKWKHLVGCTRYLYTIGSYRNCVLINEEDYTTLIWVIARGEFKELEILVNDTREVVEAVENVPPTASSQVVDQRNVSSPTQMVELMPELEPVAAVRGEPTLRNREWGEGIHSEHQCFRGGAMEFRVTLCKHAIELGFRFVYAHNNTKRIGAHCIHKEEKKCPWRVYASVEKSNGFMYIRKLVNYHTCDTVTKCLKSDRLGSQLVSNVIVEDVRARPTITPKDVMLLIKENYGFNVSYKVAYTSIRKVKNELHGDVALSYNGLQRYFDKLKELDPSSDFVLECDESTHEDESTREVKCCFVTFGACIHGFKACRPIIFLDSTFLHNKFNGQGQGQLLIASGIDGNKGLFPVAFAIVGAEDGDNWKKFLEFLRPHVNDRAITFVSNHHNDILSSLMTVFPSAHHAFCLKHIGNNIREKLTGSKFFRERMVLLFNKCAFAPNVEMFDSCLDQLIKEGGQKIEFFLSTLPKENYANAHFKGKRYGEMTSAVAESFTAQIEKYRDLSAAELIDSIRVMLMQQMFDRKEEASQWTHTLCPNMAEKFKSSFDSCRTWIVQQSSNNLYHVHSDSDPDSIMFVDIVMLTCSCCEWQVNGFPCAHAIAVLEKTGGNPYDYVEDYFHTAKIKECYSMSIPAVSIFDFHEPVADELCVNPPTTKRLPGRPRKKFSVSKGERAAREIRCGRCNQIGSHNRKSCTAPLPL